MQVEYSADYGLHVRLTDPAALQWSIDVPIEAYIFPLSKCANCGCSPTNKNDWRTCSGCLCTNFCSRPCKKNMEDDHRLECAAFQLLKESTPRTPEELPNTFRIVLRVLGSCNGLHATEAVGFYRPIQEASGSAEISRVCPYIFPIDFYYIRHLQSSQQRLGFLRATDHDANRGASDPEALLSVVIHLEDLLRKLITSGRFPFDISSIPCDLRSRLSRLVGAVKTYAIGDDQSGLLALSTSLGCFNHSKECQTHFSDAIIRPGQSPQLRLIPLTNVERNGSNLQQGDQLYIDYNCEHRSDIISESYGIMKPS